MKRVSLILPIFLSMASVCVAQKNPADAPASKEDVERYFEVVHVHDMAKTMLDLVRKQMVQLAHDQMKKQPNLPPDFDVRMNKMLDDIWNDLPVEDLLQAMIPAYEHNLTKGDIDALITFYSSPSGQKFLKQMPAIQAEGIQAATAVSNRYMDKVMARVNEEIAQALKDASDPSKKSQTN
jgi:hypothetical protein